MHTIVVTSARQNAARVLINNEDLAAIHDVVAVLKEQLLGADRIIQETDQRSVRGLVQVFDAQLILNLVNTRLQDANGLLLLIDLIVLVARQNARDARKLDVPAIQISVGRT